jgi:hypothetical protein
MAGYISNFRNGPLLFSNQVWQAYARMLAVPAKAGDKDESSPILDWSI